MKTVSLKMTDKERKEGFYGPCSPSMGGKDGPRYPYGTTINLNVAALEKMGVELSDFKSGDTYAVLASAIVTGIRSNINADGEESGELTLQITDLAIDKSKGDGLADKVKEVLSETRKG